MALLIGSWAGAAQEPKPAVEPETQVEGQENEDLAPRAPRVRLVFRRHPSLRAGRNFLRVDFRVKAQGDYRAFDPYFVTDEGDFELHRFRVGVQGRLGRDLEFEVEREINDVVSRAFRFQEENNPNPWRDLFLNYRRLRDFQIQLGRFKIPFSREQLTGPSNLDFVYRSRLGNQLAPARAVGVMLHGRFFRRGLGYEAGWFRNDGENAEYTAVIDEQRTEKRFYSGQRTFAARLAGTPLRPAPVPKVFRTIELGAAFTTSAVPEGLKGLRGRTYSKETFFRHIFVRGERRRLGTEFWWTPGPFSLKSEFVHVQEERRGQGLRGEDLPNLISRAWYVSGTWIVTGQRYAERDEPKKDFLFGRGAGAIEAAARFDAIRFGSSAHPGAPSRSPRAANVLPNSNRAWTLGLNWYPNRFFKVQLNAIRERLEDPQRTPLPGERAYWMRVVRVQFVL